MLLEEHRGEMASGHALPKWGDESPDAQIESVAVYVFWLMDCDRKSTALKSLQGKIWQQGYLRGELKGQVCDDVPLALKDWKKRNLDVRIFSSGSALAQKLLYANPEVEDLTGYLCGYLDTD